jgi:AcrR family transcriptional regulator
VEKPQCAPWRDDEVSRAPEPAAAEQRRRILGATAELVAERGYGAVTVDLIATEAEVGKATFYRHFEGKEASYLSLYDELAAEAVREVGGAYYASAGPWPERVTAALAAAFRLAEAKSFATRACLAEALGAGPAATERHERLRERLGGLLRPGRALNPRGEELPGTLEVTLAGGALWMIDRRLANEGPESRRARLPEALRFLLTPYVGDEQASEAALALGSGGD